MDKELSAPQVWLQFLALGLVGFFGGRRAWWVGLLAFAVIALGAWAQLSEMHDPFVGPNMLTEAGVGYFVQSYVAMVVSLALASAGIIIGIRRTTRQSGIHERHIPK